MVRRGLAWVPVGISLDTICGIILVCALSIENSYVLVVVFVEVDLCITPSEGFPAGMGDVYLCTAPVHIDCMPKIRRGSVVGRGK